MPRQRTLSSQVAKVRAEMSKRPTGLQQHVARVLVEALDLAHIFDVDPLRTELAVRGHDLFRAHKPAELLRLSREAGVDIAPEDERSPIMLHGPLAAVVLRERFRVTDEEALRAVSDHTTGAPEMPILAKIVLLADKFERRKRGRTPVMKEVRRLARRDLDTALLCWADWKWVEERNRGYESHPAHWAARTRWVEEHHIDAALPGRTPEATFEAMFEVD